MWMANAVVVNDHILEDIQYETDRMQMIAEETVQRIPLLWSMKNLFRIHADPYWIR